MSKWKMSSTGRQIYENSETLTFEENLIFSTFCEVTFFSIWTISWGNIIVTVRCLVQCLDQLDDCGVKWKNIPCPPSLWSFLTTPVADRRNSVAVIFLSFLSIFPCYSFFEEFLLILIKGSKDKCWTASLKQFWVWWYWPM